MQAPGDGPGPRARAGCGKLQDGAETCLGSGRAEDVRVAEERSRWGKNRQLTQEQGVACFPGTGEGESPPMGRRGSGTGQVTAHRPVGLRGGVPWPELGQSI